MKLTDYLITLIKTVHTILLIILINSNILLIKTEYFILATYRCQMLSKWFWSKILICWTHLRLEVIPFSEFDISIIFYRTLFDEQVLLCINQKIMTRKKENIYIKLSFRSRDVKFYDFSQMPTKSKNRFLIEQRNLFTNPSNVVALWVALY